MNEINKSEFRDVKFGLNSRLICKTAKISPGVVIGENVIIECENIIIGYDSKIEDGTTIKAIGGKIMEEFIMGDNCLIGFNTQILVPIFRMMDYSQIHNSSLCSGYKPLSLGFNCWVGQGAILNSYEELSIGNNVRMGGCQIWTHVASGEVMEGSNFFGSSPVIIEDNVWLMGFGQLVTPGVTLRRGSVIMAGSIVTKSTEPNKTYSGIPAKDVSDKLPAWKTVSLKEKLEMARKFTQEFLETYPDYTTKIHIVERENYSELTNILQLTDPQIVIVDSVKIGEYNNSIHSIFDLTSKTYLKRRSKVELDFIKFHLGYRARFIPN